jgi:imidazolonepropionase-like amidohydrolase
MNRIAGFALALVLFAPAVAAFGAPADPSVLVLTGGKVYPSPTAKPVPDAILLIQDGRISQIYASALSHPLSGAAIVNQNGKTILISERGARRLEIPSSAQVIDCKGKVIVAGFWNSHVHFTEDVWRPDYAAKAGNACATCLMSAHMQEMLTRWGFTTVWDLGSDPQRTKTLKEMTDNGALPGPKILMAGDIFPKNGHPVYLPAEMQLPEAASAQEAQKMAQYYLQQGLDGIKLFTGAFMGDKPVINMDTDVVKAAVDVAHAQGKPVFTHPQNRSGTDNALAGGVDVLAHTIPTEGRFTDEELLRMNRQHTALIPTLTLWPIVMQGAPKAASDKLLQAGVDELKQFFDNGGSVLFGTDVGFITEYDTTHEFEYMGRAMSWKDVLASMTTNPSAFFKAAAKGKVETGMDADLVVLDADPADDVRNLAKVAYTIRGGKVIYQRAVQQKTQP